MFRTEIVEVKGSEMPVLVFEPGTEGPHPGLVVAQHIPVAHAGLEGDPFQIETGARYAAAGFVCAMPFIFHWWPKEASIELKREKFRDDNTVADLKATVDLLSGLACCDAARIGIVGHCWGGRVSWLGACHDDRYRACGLFYGGRIKLPFSDGAPPPIELAGDIKAPVIGFFGNDDQNPTPEDVNDYEAALKRAGVRYQFYRYDGAGHGFQDSTNPQKYCHEQSEDAWAKSIAFFRTELSGSGAIEDE